MINTIGNIWNNLIEWFKDRSDRNQLVYNLIIWHERLSFKE